MRLVHEVRVTEAEITRAVQKYVLEKTHTNLPGISAVVKIQWRAKNAIVELVAAPVPTLTEEVTL